MNNPAILFGAIIVAIGGLITTGVDFTAGIGVVVFGVLVALAIRTAAEWERAVVLRLGRFAGIRGPGLFFIIPVIETVYSVVDTRRQSTRISAEDTLTLDAVSVTVDSILFWKVADVKRVATELMDYKSMIAQVAQTSLREVISAMLLADILGQRESMDARIREFIARKTESWGISDIAVEIRDVKIPPELNDAMSRNAQAEKEKQARVTLASAEVAIAQQVVDAAKIYEEHPTALQIRQMNLVYEMNKDRGSTILLPTGLATALTDMIKPKA